MAQPSNLYSEDIISTIRQVRLSTYCRVCPENSNINPILYNEIEDLLITRRFQDITWFRIKYYTQYGNFDIMTFPEFKNNYLSDPIFRSKVINYTYNYWKELTSNDPNITSLQTANSSILNRFLNVD